jgi:tripartite ATP-independent transporter DctP family solute receptor
MTTITRRTLLHSTLPAAALSVGPYVSRARGAEFVFKAATNLVASHPTNVRLTEAAERILKETDGRLEIQIFPNSQLGGETALLNQVRSGGVEIFMIGALIVSSAVPITAINGVGFAFSSYGQVWKAMDGNLGAFVREGIAKAGLYAPARPWDLGFRQISSSVHPIRTIDDLQNMKIRVPGSAAYTNVFKALGASPVSIPYPEVYSALQTKIVDGQENPLALIATSKFYEVQKYVSLTNHIWDGFWCLINAAAWQSLPAAIQEIAEKNINASGLQQRDDLATLDRTLRDDLKTKGLELNATTPDSFRAKLVSSGYYAESRSRYGERAWALLEEAVGGLG